MFTSCNQATMEQPSPSSLTELDVEGEEETQELTTASLFDVLTSLNRFLEEQELWALCRECCLTLEYLHDCHDLFQSLCISPDSVAFDSEGNICFLDLDIEPETRYLAPEHARCKQKSYKSHLFSLGMTLLFATENNTGSADLQAQLSDTFTDLLTTLTCEDIEERPDLDIVIGICEKALEGSSSQEICKKIVEIQDCESPQSDAAKTGSRFQEMTDDLCAYLESQSHLVQSAISDSVRSRSPEDNQADDKVQGKLAKSQNSMRIQNDFTDKGLEKTISNHDFKTSNQNGSLIVQSMGFDDEDSVLEEDQLDLVEVRQSTQQKIMLLADLLTSLDRCLEEFELWSICRECVISLQRKRKHLPAYISLDTITIRDSGTVSFKAIPEDKPLEVIYMAPELQQRGLLNDKTCLYGLGIALRSAAAFKCSSSQSVPGGEALEILITSFIYGNPDKRPDLETAYEMCGEYEKVSKTNSQQVCLQLYEEALNMHGSSNDADSEYVTRASFDPSIPGNAPIAEDSKNKISRDTTHKNIQKLTTGSQYKSLNPSDPGATESQSLSAFKNVAAKPKLNNDMKRLPSAFSSPATHFKPIVIQNVGAEATVLDQQHFSVEKAHKDSHVGADNVQHNLEHTVPEPLSKSLREPGKSNPESANRKTVINTAELGQTLHQLQSQGHLPSTDILASALAHYLTGCLTESASKQSFVAAGHHKEHSNSISVTSIDTSATASSTQSFAAVPQYSMQTQPIPQMNNLPQQTMNHNFHVTQQTNMLSPASTVSGTMPTLQAPQPHSGQFSETQENLARDSNSSSRSQNPSSNTHVAGIPLQQMSGTFPFPLSTSGSVHHGSGHYSIPFSGLSPTNVSVQYTLVQDPATGLMQMLSIPYVPISQTQTSQAIPVMQNCLPNMDINILPNKLYKADNGEMKWSHRFSQEPKVSHRSQPKLPSWHQPHSNHNRSPRDGQVRVTETVPNDYQQMFTFRPRASLIQNDRNGNNIQTSNSPSKDSGISLSHQPESLLYNMGIKMDRQQSSTNCDKYRTFYHVVDIIQETFGEDEMSDYESNYLDIAEYIMSLSSLTWDTFCNAVMEKYYHLVWSYEVLNILFHTIEGHMPLKLNHMTELPPAKFSRLHYRASEEEFMEHLQLEPDNDNSNRQRNYSSVNHQHQNVYHNQREKRETRLLSNQHQQNSQERQQFFNGHLQERYKRQQSSNQYKPDSRERQRLSNQVQLDNRERYHMSNKHEYHSQERRQFSNQHKLDGQERQLSNQTHPVQAITVNATSVSHSIKSQHSLSDFSRPKSEIIRQKNLWRETSDYTDSEARYKKQHFKKHIELNKTKKSLSLHNLNFSGPSSAAIESESTERNAGCRANSAEGMSHKNNHVLSNCITTNKPGPSQICQDYISADGKMKSASLQDYISADGKMKSASPQDYISADGKMKSASPQTDLASGNSFKSNQLRAVTHPSSVHPSSMLPDRHGGYSSPPVSVVSHSSSSTSDRSQEHKQHNLPTYISPDTETTARHSQYSQDTSNPKLVPGNIPPLPSPYTIPNLQTYVQTNRDYTDPSHSQPSVLQHNTASNSLKQHPVYGHSNINLQMNNALPSDKLGSPEEKMSSASTRFHGESARAHRTSTSLNNSRHYSHKHVPTFLAIPNVGKCSDRSGSFDSENNVPEEMRKLAAEKPELYNVRISTGISASQDKGKQITNLTNVGDSQNTFPQQTEMLPNKISNHYNIKSQSNSHDFPVLRNKHDASYSSSTGPKPSFEGISKSVVNPVDYEPSLPDSLAQRPDDSRASHNNVRSFSAVYSRQSKQPPTGVEVLNSAGTNNTPDTRHRKASGGFDQMPEINSVLLPYVKRSSIVYLSAMIQLSLTAEVDAFIHSIDEENRPAIEKLLASITQEIAVQRRQRQKTQRLYKKLNEQNATSKKGDQSVSEQTLRDMSDMTKKLSFLHLCQTHLQMLLAELHGLDSDLLWSLSITEGNAQLSLQPATRNPYLQFRSISTPGAEQMDVLQAGTPRGLMSYLYTSSALSNGYIHQFLFCFRYILTADQLLTFILEKYHSAHRNNQKDVNMICIQRRSIDLLHFWIEGYYSLDFALNKGLLKKFSDFLTEQTKSNAEGADNLYSLYAACRLGETTELMHMTEMDEDNIDEGTYFFYLDNSKRWDSFRSLLKRSKSDKSNKGSRGGSLKSNYKSPSAGSDKSSIQFLVADCSAHVLAEQLTLIEQEQFKKCHPIHFLNSQFQGVGVALSMPGLRTPSMSRKLEASQSPKRGLFVGEPAIESYVVHMINHAQELAHWVSAEVLSCGSNKAQISVITKFLTAAHLCHHVRNYATALSILDGLENIVVRQLPVWKNIPAKVMSYIDDLTNMKMKLKSEALWLMSGKNCHIFPTIPCALFVALHIQQVEIGSFTLASGMYKWDKMRSISEIVDQLRIFRDHNYAFQHDFEIQRSLRRCLSEYSEQDLHAVASTQNNNFHRHHSSSSLSGTLKKVKNILRKKS